MCCYRPLLFFIPLSLSLLQRLSSPLNTAGWLTGPLRALVAGWIKRWYKKRLKGRRKQWLLKEGEGGRGRNNRLAHERPASANQEVLREGTWASWCVVGVGQSPGDTGVRVGAPLDQRVHDTRAHKDHRLIPQHQQLELTSNCKPCSLDFVVFHLTVLLGDGGPVSQRSS